MNIRKLGRWAIPLALLAGLVPPAWAMEAQDEEPSRSKCDKSD